MPKSVNSVLGLIAESIKTQRPFGIVSGNQSGDLDSIVSAIAYAYFNHNTSNQKIIVPLLNFAKNELGSRKDVLLAFKNSEVDSKNLFFTDDIPYLIKQGANELILVDHNVPQGSVKDSLSSLPITGIIDHHEDEKKSQDIQPRIIRSSGSCSSLVFNYWNDNNPLKFEDSKIIKLLVASLIIDTSNLTSKVEEPDVKAFKHYQRILEDSGNFGQFDVTSFFQDLKEAKNNIEGLSLEEVLAKDYKLFEFEIGSSDVIKRVGFSSIVKPFTWLLSNTVSSDDKLIEETREFISSNNLDILVLMTSYVNSESEFIRELSVLGRDESDRLLTKLALDNTLKDELNLVPISPFDQENPDLQVYQQMEVSFSRKQVAPSFKRAFEIL